MEELVQMMKTNMQNVCLSTFRHYVFLFCASFVCESDLWWYLSSMPNNVMLTPLRCRIWEPGDRVADATQQEA